MMQTWCLGKADTRLFTPVTVRTRRQSFERNADAAADIWRDKKKRGIYLPADVQIQANQGNLSKMKLLSRLHPDVGKDKVLLRG